MTPTPKSHHHTVWVNASGTWRIYASTSTSSGADYQTGVATREFGAENVKHLHPIFKQH